MIRECFAMARDLIALTAFMLAVGFVAAIITGVL
jgi:hypothetical protein